MYVYDRFLADERMSLLKPNLNLLQNSNAILKASGKLAFTIPQNPNR